MPQAGIAKYFAATWESSGYLLLLALHQSKGDCEVASSPMYRDREKHEVNSMRTCVACG